MGIELKTKSGGSLQTLFSRVPSRFVACASRAELLRRYGRPNKKTGRLDLYTSFKCTPDSFGFMLHDSGEEVQVRNGEEVVLAYAYEDLEASLLSKHAETAFVSVETFGTTCQFPSVLYCKGPSMLRFLRLLCAGQVNLDFTLSASGQGAKDHGFLWRIEQARIQDLYVSNSGLIDFRRAVDAASQGELLRPGALRCCGGQKT